ncbi:MAG: ABC transporter permease [Myxococcales bacterium]
MRTSTAPVALRGAVVAGGLSALAILGIVLAHPAPFDRLRAAAFQPGYWGVVAGYVVLAGLALRLAVRSQRMPQGMPGRLRTGVLAYAFLALGLGGASLFSVLLRTAPELPPGTPIGLEDAILMFPRPLQIALVVSSVVGGVGALVGLVSLIGLWFLLPLKLRGVLFALVDVLLLGGTTWLTWKFSFQPTSTQPNDLVGPSARLLVTFLFGVRMAARLLPYALDGIEGIDFRSLVAARHLRAKKSGFLAAISFLSILAVSVSSCALTTTLSVMGGFRQDLKRKILGNNAHIVVDQPNGKIGTFEPLVETTRGVADVKGVSPYVTGEVMISSASNLAGAVLRGIDVSQIGQVSDLPQNMKVGSLDYLSHPEKLLRLPATQLGVSILPKVTRANSESETDRQKAARLTRELRDILGADAGLDPIEGLDEEEEEEEEETEAAALLAPKPGTPEVEQPHVEGAQPSVVSAGSSLPGIVVGQELARSLRLYLGDEVNVVTPLGDLGPTGPMPKSRAFRVAGIFYSGMYEYDMKFAYVTLEAAQKFLGAPSAISGIEVTVNEPERARETAARIEKALARPDLRVRGWEELNKNLFGALALEKLAMFIALGLTILVASFCIFSTLTLMVQEKGREVAVLKAMGAADRAIVSIFVLEGTMIAVLGSFMGLAMGYVMCFAMEHFGVRLNPEVYYIDRLPVHTDGSEFFTVGLAAMLVCVIVTIYPAKLASRLQPVDALRYE